MSSEIPDVLQPPTVEHLQRSRLWSAPLRVLPDFIILGAQKAGTTTLHAYLVQHPAIAPALAKEIHFLDYNYARGEAWYRAHFPTFFARWRGKFLRTGEGSPYYLFYPHAAWRAAHLVPHCKLIVLLRHPVERAYSHYHHQVRLGLESLSFSDALADEASRLDGEFEKIVADPEYYSFNYQNYSYLARGMYAAQLEHWFRYFAREQFLILPSDEFYGDTARTFGRVLDFLNVPRWQPGAFQPLNEGAYEPMDAATHARWSGFFAPHNARLYELLNVDFGWK